MDSYKRTLIINAQILIKERFMKEFNVIDEEKLERSSKLLENLMLCLNFAKDGSLRHIRILIPKLLKEAENQFNITFDFDAGFVELMNER